MWENKAIGPCPRLSTIKTFIQLNMLIKLRTEAFWGSRDLNQSPSEVIGPGEMIFRCSLQGSFLNASLHFSWRLQLSKNREWLLKKAIHESPKPSERHTLSFNGVCDMGTWVSKTPQKHWLVHAAPQKKLQNHLVQWCIAKEMRMLKASQKSPW